MDDTIEPMLPPSAKPPPPTPSFAVSPVQHDANEGVERHETKFEAMMKGPFRAIRGLWNKEAKS